MRKISGERILKQKHETRECMAVQCLSVINVAHFVDLFKR